MSMHTSQEYPFETIWCQSMGCEYLHSTTHHALFNNVFLYIIEICKKKNNNK